MIGFYYMKHRCYGHRFMDLGANGSHLKFYPQLIPLEDMSTKSLVFALSKNIELPDFLIALPGKLHYSSNHLISKTLENQSLE